MFVKYMNSRSENLYLPGRSMNAWVKANCYSGRRTGNLPYERGGDAHWKIDMKPLKETNLGVAQAFLTTKR